MRLLVKKVDYMFFTIILRIVLQIDDCRLFQTATIYKLTFKA